MAKSFLWTKKSCKKTISKCLDALKGISTKCCQTKTPSAVKTEAPSAVKAEAPSAVKTEAPSAVKAEAPSAVKTEAPSAVKTEAPSASNKNKMKFCNLADLVMPWHAILAAPA